MRSVTTNELQTLHVTELHIFNFNWLTVAEPWSRPHIREPQLFKITLLDNSVQFIYNYAASNLKLNESCCH